MSSWRKSIGKTGDKQSGSCSTRCARGLDEDEERGRVALARSAAPVIEHLQRIEAQLLQLTLRELFWFCADQVDQAAVNALPSASATSRISSGSSSTRLVQQLRQPPRIYERVAVDTELAPQRHSAPPTKHRQPWTGTAGAFVSTPRAPLRSAFSVRPAASFCRAQRLPASRRQTTACGPRSCPRSASRRSRRHPTARPPGGRCCRGSRASVDRSRRSPWDNAETRRRRSNSLPAAPVAQACSCWGVLLKLQQQTPNVRGGALGAAPGFPGCPPPLELTPGAGAGRSKVEVVFLSHCRDYRHVKGLLEAGGIEAIPKSAPNTSAKHSGSFRNRQQPRGVKITSKVYCPAIRAFPDHRTDVDGSYQRMDDPRCLWCRDRRRRRRGGRRGRLARGER